MDEKDVLFGSVMSMWHLLTNYVKIKNRIIMSTYNNYTSILHYNIPCSLATRHRRWYWWRWSAWMGMEPRSCIGKKGPMVHLAKLSRCDLKIWRSRSLLFGLAKQAKASKERPSLLILLLQFMRNFRFILSYAG